MKFFLDQESIRMIRLAVQMDMPDETDREQAKAFAASIHQKMDEHFYGLDTDDREVLKKSVIKAAVKKQTFVMTESEFRAIAEDIVSPDELDQLLTQPLPVEQVESAGLKKRWSPVNISSGSAAAVLVLVFLAGATNLNTESVETTQLQERVTPFEDTKISKQMAESTDRPANELPQEMTFHEVDLRGLTEWLEERESLLADEEYIHTIIDVADDFNIHPFVMIAIAGQEQSFVPRDHPSASEMIHNPYNVFHSWRDYNTDLEDSTKIVSRTITTLSADRPEGMDVFQWMNRKYAEHDEWWLGVRYFYDQLTEEIDYDKGGTVYDH